MKRRTSSDIAARFLSRRSAKTWAPHEETVALREALLQATGRYPRQAMQLFEDVTGEWGSLGERRLWRALQWLVAEGLVVRVGDRFHSEGYVRARETQARRAA